MRQHSRSWRTFSSSPFFRYSFAIIVTVVAFFVSLAFQPLFTRGTFALFYIAVLLSAWFGGLGPALVSMALAALGTA